MRACSRDLQSRAFRGGDEFAARAMHFNAQLADVLADARTRLDDGLMQFVLHLLCDIRRSRGDELADVRTQLARRGINDLELFLDANGKAVSHGFGPLDLLGPVGDFEFRIIPRRGAKYTNAAYRQARCWFQTRKGQTEMSVPLETCWAGPFPT